MAVERGRGAAGGSPCLPWQKCLFYKEKKKKRKIKNSQTSLKGSARNFWLSQHLCLCH